MDDRIEPGRDDGEAPSDDDAPAEAGRPERIDLDAPFSRGDLERAGLSREMLRRHCDFVEVLPRVWILKSAVDHETKIRAALYLHPPRAFASHLSAAEVLGLPVPDHGFAHVTVDRAEDRRFRPGLKPHVTGRKRRVIVVRGIRTTDPIQTFIDCAGWLSLVDLVVLGDALAKRYRIKAARLVTACRESTDYYRTAALKAALLVRDGVDSPMETRLRLLIVFAGLPEPLVNFIKRDAEGNWLRRFDLYYALVKVIVEYDGRQHAEDRAQWNGDLKRREELDDDGYRILVVTAEGLYRQPLRTLQRIRRLLVERGMPDVPEIGDGWRVHFGA